MFKRMFKRVMRNIIKSRMRAAKRHVEQMYGRESVAAARERMKDNYR